MYRGRAPNSGEGAINATNAVRPMQQRGEMEQHIKAGGWAIIPSRTAQHMTGHKKRECTDKDKTTLTDLNTRQLRVLTTAGSQLHRDHRQITPFLLGHHDGRSHTTPHESQHTIVQQLCDVPGMLQSKSGANST